MDDPIDILLAELTSTTGLPWPIVLLRLAGALVAAGIIGFERELDNRPAGLRTHMLTGLAACVYCIVMLALLDQAADEGDHIRTDPIRVVEAVTQGVAFLAAGLIVFTRGEIRGLTTGAGMWLAAAIGLACGLGLWVLAGVTTFMALIVIRVLKIGERRMLHPGKDDGPAP